MKILSYDVPLGLSTSAHSPEAIQGFIDAGFTHFEIGISAHLPGAAYPETKDVREPAYVRQCAEAAQRGSEEKLAQMQDARVRKLRENGICPWSVHLPFGPGWDVAHVLRGEREDVCESLKRMIGLTADWGARVYVLHGCLEPVTAEERALRMARSIASLKELDEYASRFGARIALENLPRSCLGNSSEEVLAMSDAAGNLPVVFDVNHLLCESHDKFLDALAHRVISTHLSDYDGIDERHALPGNGIVPWRYVVTRLCGAGYKGPFLFELREGENGPYEAREVLDAFIGALEA